MHQHPLNKIYDEFKAGYITRDELEGTVYEYLLNNQLKSSLAHWKNDEYEDFISWLYPRLHKAIDSYQETGSTFDIYIGTVMRLSAREYRVRRITKSVTEYSAWSVRVPELYVHEESQAYSFENRENQIQNTTVEKHGRKSPRQFLILILKCYYYVSDDFLERIAIHTGTKFEELRDMVAKLRNIRQKKDDELYLLKERIYCQYYRCIVYEKRLTYIPEDTVNHVRLKEKLLKARSRLEKMRLRAAKIRTDATNREIAEVIGISKGSVDASLHRLKTKFEQLADKSMLN